MRFIDLFAGLGGFHLALGRLGHECVFASEFDADLATLYKKNFEIEPAGDIREVRLRDIPAHDIPVRRLPMPAILKGRRAARLAMPSVGRPDRLRCTHSATP